MKVLTKIFDSIIDSGLFHVFSDDDNLADDLFEAVFIDGFDRLPRKVRPAVLEMPGKSPGAKMVWATVAVSTTTSIWK